MAGGGAPKQQCVVTESPQQPTAVATNIILSPQQWHPRAVDTEDPLLQRQHTTAMENLRQIPHPTVVLSPLFPNPTYCDAPHPTSRKKSHKNIKSLSDWFFVVFRCGKVVVLGNKK